MCYDFMRKTSFQVVCKISAFPPKMGGGIEEYLLKHDHEVSRVEYLSYCFVVIIKFMLYLY